MGDGSVVITPNRRQNVTRFVHRSLSCKSLEFTITGRQDFGTSIGGTGLERRGRMAERLGIVGRDRRLNLCRGIVVALQKGLEHQARQAHAAAMARRQAFKRLP